MRFLGLFCCLLFAMMCIGCVSTLYDQDGFAIEEPDADNIVASRIRLGEAYLKHKSYNLALVNFKKAATIDPKSNLVALAFAHYYEAVSNLDLADYYYKDSLGIDADYSLANLDYALFLCRNKRYDEMQPFFDKSMILIKANKKLNFSYLNCISDII